MFRIFEWEDSRGLILVQSEDQFRDHEDGFPHLESVGLPIEDVFVGELGSGLSELEPNSLLRRRNLDLMGNLCQVLSHLRRNKKVKELIGN